MAEIKAERPVGHLLAGFRQWCCSLLALASLDFNGASENPSKAATPPLILPTISKGMPKGSLLAAIFLAFRMQKTRKWVAKSGLLQPCS